MTETIMVTGGLSRRPPPPLHPTSTRRRDSSRPSSSPPPPPRSSGSPSPPRPRPPRRGPHPGPASPWSSRILTERRTRQPSSPRARLTTPLDPPSIASPPPTEPGHSTLPWRSREIWWRDLHLRFWMISLTSCPRTPRWREKAGHRTPANGSEMMTIIIIPIRPPQRAGQNWNQGQHRPRPGRVSQNRRRTKLKSGNSHRSGERWNPRRPSPLPPGPHLSEPPGRGLPGPPPPRGPRRKQARPQGHSGGPPRDLHQP